MCTGGDCKNTIGSFECACPAGTVMDENQECVDENECETGNHDCFHGRCVNTDPGYNCICQPGFISTQDRRGCLDGRQGTCYTTFTSGGLCVNEMSFKLSRIDCCCGKTFGKGWKFNVKDLCEPCPSQGTSEFNILCDRALEILAPTNIDECSLRSDLCENGLCVNTDAGKCQFLN